MTVPFPGEELRRIGLSREAIAWARALGERIATLEEIATLNGDTLMPISAVEITTAFVTGTSGSEQTILTAADDTLTFLKKIVLHNTDNSSAVTISAWLVPSGGTLGDANQVIEDLSIAAKATTEPTGLQNRVLEPGTVLAVAASSASKITLGGYYSQRTRGQ